MEKLKITPPHYEKPHVEAIEIVNSGPLLQASQVGDGVIPPTPNENSDFDW